MSGVVAVVLKMTLGLFVKKARSSLSKKLSKDGGLNSKQLRSLIMSNLEDVKTKLDGLARGNLLSSVSFIQEGLRLLDDLLNKPNTPKLPPQEEDDKVGGSSNRACNPDQASSSNSDLPLNVDSAVKLAEAINEMKINSSDHFTSAMALFKNANTKATEAFHNESLSLEDRILAAKLRVQSRLLLSLENPSLAIHPCRLYLEELHGLASIVEVFRNDLERRMLSFLNRKKRHELVLSVSAINFVVFKFLQSFTTGPINLYDWPDLKSGDWTYSPLIPNKAICMELHGNAGIEFPYLVVFKEFGWKNMVRHELETVAVNSNGEIIVGYTHSGSHNVTFGKVTMNKVKTSPLSGEGIRTHHLLLLVVDSNDNMYVLADRACCTSELLEVSPSIQIDPEICDLTAFDSKNLLIEQIGYCPGKNILVPTPDGFALMSYNENSCINAEVTLYKNSKGKIQRSFSFQTKLWESSLITVTNKYQVVAVEQSGYRVRVYEKDGQLIREFELYGGKRETCVSVAFNYLTEELVFVSRVGSWYFLSTYEPETGKRHHNVKLSLFGEEQQYLRLTAHCSGPMALVSLECVLYLQ